MHIFLSFLSLFIVATLNCDFMQRLYPSHSIHHLEYFSKSAYVARGHWDRFLTAALVLVYRKYQVWHAYAETQDGGSDNSWNNVVTSDLERLGGYQDQSRRTQNTSPPREFDLPAFQALTSRYTYCVKTGTSFNIYYIIIF